jgi:hypothetical protein
MFDTNLTVNDGTSDLEFALRSILDGKSIRADATAALGEPRTLTISHSKRNPKDPESPDRHLARVDVTKHDTDGKPFIASAYIVVENPVNGLFDNDDIRALMTLVINTTYNPEGRMDKFLNNEP